MLCNVPNTNKFNVPDIIEGSVSEEFGIFNLNSTNSQNQLKDILWNNKIKKDKNH
jgi:hypothetical protein